MWKTVKLDDIFNFKNGRSFKKTEWKENGLPIIRIQNLNNANASFNYFEGEYDSSIEVNNGDLLFSWSGTVGTSFGAHIWERDKGVLNQHIFKLTKKSEIDTRYAFYCLKHITKLIEQSVVGAVGIRHVTKKNLVEFEIPLPSLAEQERIVAKLDAAFAEIDEAINAAIAKETEVQKLKASLLSSSLSGDAVMWKTQKLSDVIEKGETVNPTINPDTKFSYIDVSSVDRKNFSISKTQTLRGKDAPSRARRLVRMGDVLFATIRPTLQRIAIVPEKLNGEVCSTGYIVLRPKASIICSKFIFYYMLSEKVNTQMEELQTGASYPAVNDTQVKNLLISFPSLAEQQLISARLDAAYSEFKNTNELIAKSKLNLLALKSAILTQELQPSEAA